MLAVEALLADAAGAALEAFADLTEVRTGRRPEVAVDRERLVVAAASERHVRLDGAVVSAPFDPLSAFFEAADGWVRTHGNYPWHREALLRAVGPDVAAGIAGRPALEVEAAVVAAGGCAAAVRRTGEWTTAHGLTEWSPGPLSDRPLGDPLRVVDLTRVIAGPVGTRMLAALGADVTRVDDPRRPELPLVDLDGGLGKRRAALDLRTTDGRKALERLLSDADALVLGHRPGALDAHGLHPDAVAGRHPHVVVVSLSAWGGPGPSGALRGFDSLVQAATGIALETGSPGALPVQALDHATGYLVCAAVLRALARRARSGEAPRASLALAATAQDLLGRGRTDAPFPDVDPAPHLADVGRVRAVLPPGRIDGRPLTWPRP